MRVLLFGRLRDIAGAGEITAPERFPSLAELRAWLAHEHADLAEAIAERSIRVAVDRKLIQGGDADLRAAEEVAFMPPMSGG
jgi:molybdopterin converting factor small subunit